MTMIDRWQNNHNNVKIWKFGKQVELKNIEVIRPVYNVSVREVIKSE